MSPSEFVLVLVIGSSIWVYFDAKAIGVKKGQVQGLANMSPGGWFLSCILLWIFTMPLYIASREKYKRINQQAHPNLIAGTAITSQSVSDIDVRKCPYCAEIIKREAIVCRFCSRDLNIPNTLIDNKKTATTPSLQPGDADSIRICPKCGVPMIIKVANNGEFQGKSFYVCPNYTQCQQALPLG